MLNRFFAALRSFVRGQEPTAVVVQASSGVDGDRRSSPVIRSAEASSASSARIRRVIERARRDGLSSRVIDALVAARLRLRAHDPAAAFVEIDASKPMQSFRFDLDDPAAADGPLSRRFPELDDGQIETASELLGSLIKVAMRERDRSARRLASRHAMDHFELPTSVVAGVDFLAGE